MVDVITSARYVIDGHGEKTDVLIPLSTWKTMLTVWRQMIEMLEDQQDGATLQDWLAERAAGEADMLSLDDLERELIAIDLGIGNSETSAVPV